jgi:ferredoxin
MSSDGNNIVICSCEDTMPLDATAIRRGCRGAAVTTARQLCGAELDRFRALAREPAPLTVGCTQEAHRFAQAAAESGRASPTTYVNIRETAGWSSEAAAAGPKMAALLAAAAESAPDVPSIDIESRGVILIYGRDESAVEAGDWLKEHLDVTVLIEPPAAILPRRSDDFPVTKGKIRAATGHLGAFEIVIDDFAPPEPSSRETLRFGPSRDGARSHCDVILDLSGKGALFAAAELRDGYLRADPGNRAALLEAVLKARDLVGRFAKPRYIAFDPALCAHSRSSIVGCTRCLDLCPAGAIAPDGDHVAIDPHVCAGCGQCASVCPTGAAAYTMPPVDTLLRQLRAMLLTYREAGGERAILLLHDERHGAKLIDALARSGDGFAGASAAARRQRGHADRHREHRRRFRLRRLCAAVPLARAAAPRRHGIAADDRAGGAHSDRARLRRRPRCDHRDGRSGGAERRLARDPGAAAGAASGKLPSHGSETQRVAHGARRAAARCARSGGVDRAARRGALRHRRDRCRRLHSLPLLCLGLSDRRSRR